MQIVKMRGSRKRLGVMGCKAGGGTHKRGSEGAVSEEESLERCPGSSASKEQVFKGKKSFLSNPA